MRRNFVTNKESYNHNYTYNWTVGVPGKTKTMMPNVCKNFFLVCYQVGHTTVDEISAEIKKGVVRTCSPFTENAAAIRRGTPEECEVSMFHEEGPCYC